MSFLQNLNPTTWKRANSLKDWGIFAMLMLGFVIVVCVPFLAIFGGLYLILSRYYDYREAIYEMKTKRIMVDRMTRVMQTESKNELKKERS